MKLTPDSQLPMTEILSSEKENTYIKYKALILGHGNNHFEQYYDNPTSKTRHIVQYYDNNIKHYEGSVSNFDNVKVEKQIGCWKVYHPNGRLKMRCDFSAEGVLHGSFVEYHSDGQLYFKCNFQNGEQASLAESYDSEGNEKNIIAEEIVHTIEGIETCRFKFDNNKFIKKLNVPAIKSNERNKNCTCQ